MRQQRITYRRRKPTLKTQMTAAPFEEVGDRVAMTRLSLARLCVEYLVPLDDCGTLSPIGSLRAIDRVLGKYAAILLVTTAFGRGTRNGSPS